MPYYCTVPRCTSMAGKAKNVSFHQFPRDEELARLWNDILKRGKPYTKYSKVCSLHFRPEDYTITSVGKNKGQWRTLRKDAVPSRNLPSETPAPYSRKQWESWSQNSCTPTVMDPSIHQHVAQAIYMQTMLAMQAAGTTENTQLNGLLPPEMAPPHTSTQEDRNNKQHNIDSVSYKCEQCTKCFKDPDVFILHKRSHSRDKSNGVEKENFNMNLTLRSNPILANLLKTNNEANFDPSIMTVESILMTALAANMDYIRNLSMGKERECDSMNRDRDDTIHDRTDSGAGNDSNRLHSDLNSKELHKSDSNYGDDNNVRNPSGDKEVSRYTHCLNNSRNDAYVEAKYTKSDLNQDVIGALGDQNEFLNHSKTDPNDDQNLPKSELNRQKSDSNIQNSDPPIGLSYAMNFSTKLSDSGAESLKYNGNYYRERLFSSEFDRENNLSDSDTKNLENVRSQCDNDLNESMDSNSLVIDENA